jgi:transcriptional regulator with XRE-family HTH domain
MRVNQEELGNKIREIRKSVGISMKQLAEKVGVTQLTIHRIEKGKVSPSVVLLSEIAYHLNYPIQSFVAENEKSVLLIKGDSLPIIKSEKMHLKILAPKGTLNEKMSVTLGKADKGEFISKHKNKGIELTYILKGKNIFKYGIREYELNQGDLIYHDGKDYHSVTAIEPTEFLNIHFTDD